MKLGIYGGTFNPPHLGHLTSARLALDALGLDELRFVPAALPPHKRLPPDAPGPEARLEMVELAADGLLCTTMELRRDSLRAVKSNFLFEEIVVAVGNHASEGVARRAGAQWECVARNRLQLHGAAVPASVFSLVP